MDRNQPSPISRKHVLGRAHVALGGDRIAGEQLDVAAEQLLDARLPDQTQVSCQGAALLDVPTGLVESAAHRLQQGDEAGQVRVEGAILRLPSEQPLEPVEALGDRHRAVDRAEGVLAERPADLAAIAGAAGVLGRSVAASLVSLSLPWLQRRSERTMYARASPASSPSSPSASIAVSASNERASMSIFPGSLYISIRGL